MSNLIDRQLVLDRINKQREHLRPYLYPQDKIGDSAYRICFEFVERIPSAQPEPKKGKWIYYDPNGFKCSECGGYLEIEVGDVKMKFCPNCGSYNGCEEDE